MKKTSLFLALCGLIFFNFGCNSIEEKIDNNINPALIAKVKDKAASEGEKLKTRFADRINNRFNKPKATEADIRTDAILHFPMLIDGTRLACQRRTFVYKNETYHVMAYLEGTQYAIQKLDDKNAIICRELQLPYKQVMYDDAYLVEKLYLLLSDAFDMEGKDYTGKRFEIPFIEGGITANNLPKRFVNYSYQSRYNKFMPVKKMDVVFEWDELRYSAEIEDF